MNMMTKARDRFMSEFEQMYSKVSSEEKITKECVETMKDLLKCVYYIDAIEGMASGFEGEDNGYSRGFRSSYDGRYPNRPYYDDGYSGRRRSRGRSYDDEKRSAMNRLHEIMNNEPNEEVRMAIQSVMRELGD